MEHEPWLRDVARPRPRTTYLCQDHEEDICNDVAKFASWPESQGWSSGPDTTLIELARQCQAWLFFGLINIAHVIVEVDFKVEDYIDGDHPNLINSKTLSILFERIRSTTKACRQASTPRPLLSPLLLRQLARDIIFDRNDWLSNIVAQSQSSPHVCNPWDCETCNAIWSSLMLLETFAQIPDSQFINTLLGDLPQTMDIDSTSHGSDQSTPKSRHPSILVDNLATLCRTRHITEGLRLLGRCPTLNRRLNLTPLHVYALMSIPCQSVSVHIDCQDRNCKAFDVQEEHYQMRHAADCDNHQECESSPLSVTAPALGQLVSDDHNVAVRSHLGADGILHVDIVDATRMENVTAISHVWAGGLGNFKENGHYRCQLLWLHEYLLPYRHLHGQSSTVHYWLDTLCIPIEGALKTKAIDAMASSYAGCQSVLVIDPDLALTRARSLSWKEMTLVLLSSSWMARSWTLQEAALAVQLDFAFLDKSVSFDEIDILGTLSLLTMLQSLWKADVSLWNLDSALNEEKAARLSDKEHIRRLNEANPNLRPEQRFLSVWNQLCNRSSTKVDDLPIILAVFLGCRASDLEHLSPSEKMHTLLRSQSELPVALLFAHQDSRANGWCPVFPTCAGPLNILSDAMGFMKVRTDGCFEISCLKTTMLLECQQSLPADATIHLDDLARNRRIELHFSTSSSTQNVNGRSMFLLSREKTTSTSGHGFRGLHFVMLTDDNRCVHLLFIRSCIWRLIQEAKTDTASGVQANSHKDTTSDVGATSTSEVIVSERTPVIPTRPLVLDMGINCSPPAWSRPASYPFTATTLNLERLLTGMKYSYNITCGQILLSVRYSVSSLLKGTNPISAEFAIRSIIFNVTVYWLRSIIANAEMSWLRGMMHRRVQRIWASSFKPLGLAPNHTPLLDATRYKVLIFWVVAQGLAFIGSFVYMKIEYKNGLLSAAEEEGYFWLRIVMNINDMFLSPKPASAPFLNLMRPLIVTTYTHLMLRLFVVIWYRPWRIQRASVKLPKQNTFRESGTAAQTPFDIARLLNRGHQWNFFAGLSIFAIVVVAYVLPVEWYASIKETLLLWNRIVPVWTAVLYLNRVAMPMAAATFLTPRYGSYLRKHIFITWMNAMRGILGGSMSRIISYYLNIVTGNTYASFVLGTLIVVGLGLLYEPITGESIVFTY